MTDEQETTPEEALKAAHSLLRGLGGPDHEQPDRREYEEVMGKVESGLESLEDDPDEEKAICIDCLWHDSEPIPDPCPEGYICPHWKPEYWEEQGFDRYWGDAAVNNWPDIEILRKETEDQAEFVILAPFVLRRPVTIRANDPTAWGGY